MQGDIEARLTPLWVTAKLHNSEAAALSEKARREASESRTRSLQEQLSKEAQLQHGVEQARDAAVGEVEGLKALVGAKDEALRLSAENASNLARQLAFEVSEAGVLKAQIEAKAETSRRLAESLSDLARKLAFETAELKDSRAKHGLLQQRLSQLDAELASQREAAASATDGLNASKAAEAAAAGGKTASHDQATHIAIGFGLLSGFGACRPDLVEHAALRLQTVVGTYLPVDALSTFALFGVLLAWIVVIFVARDDRAPAFIFYGLVVVAPIAVVGYLSLGVRLENWSPTGKGWLSWLGFFQGLIGFANILSGLSSNRAAKS